MMFIALQQALLSLVLSAHVGSAPLLVTARVTVSDLLRGEVCLVWDSLVEYHRDCWSAELGPRTKWIQVTLHTPGTYEVYAATASLKSNTAIVEVK